MDERERQGRLAAFGLSEEPPKEAPQQRTSEPQSPLHEPEAAPHGDRPTGVTGALRTGSTLDQMVHSWGFLLGMVVMLGAVLAGLASDWGWLPPGEVGWLAAAATVFFLSPSSLTLWWAVGVLAPPAPFRTGLLLGIVQASLFTLLAYQLEDVGRWVGSRDLASVGGLWLLALVVAALGTGITGWLVRRIFMEKVPPGVAESPARPLPAVVIALTFVCLPLMTLVDDSAEWLALGLYGALITGSMIAWGLAVQRRHPERRWLIVVVGLVAGLVAGLAMLQAIWTEGRWSNRRKLTDAIAITAGAAMVLLAAYGAYGPGGEFTSRTYVVAPARGANPSSAEVDLARDLLEARMEAIGAEPTTRVRDDGHITVRVAETFDPDVVARSLGSTGILEFTPVPEQYAWDLLQDQPLPEGMVEIEPILGGSEVTTARLGQDGTTGEIVVNLEFNETGARLFDEYAEEHFGERFAIVFDDVVVSAPSINATRFGGQAMISGNFTVAEAQAIVAALSAGRSLPYEVTVEGG